MAASLNLKTINILQHFQIQKLIPAMSSLRFSSTFYLLSFAFLLQTAFGADINPLFRSCSNETFTANIPYQINLNKLMGYLYYQAPPTGFGLASLGQNPNQVHGLALCRGDVSTSDCKTCVADASSNIRKNCPYSKHATIFYDNCFLKYSNEDFFGQIDNGPKWYMWNVNNVSNPVISNEKSKELLSHLAKQASTSPKLYAAGELEMEESKKLYGLAQCTRDLSYDDCKLCLDGIIDDLPSCCDGKQGGRVITGSCTIRYEIYPFVKA
ncbi:Cysteine-rich repeat secretory protein [Melia azedarach]|uniref:Cysteine-rich repeat secretory protein n=1 Tax=Melia azedarach TaxID=155640 RepID=A0ACC1Z3W4_MELAZ|nr:Cysteine-rich repeat secretory protein [Melia azedarach]